MLTNTNVSVKLNRNLACVALDIQTVICDLANLNKHTLFTMNSFDTNFSCFTSSLTQHHSFFSYSKETKPFKFIRMQSKIASHILTVKKAADCRLLFSFVLVAAFWVLWRHFGFCAVFYISFMV